jgi:hypothetical protein
MNNLLDQIRNFMSSSQDLEKISALSHSSLEERVVSLEEKFSNLAKDITDNRELLLFLSQIQCDLAGEYHLLTGDMEKSKKSLSLPLFPIRDDDDDLIN